jgi:hypothetical protein
MKNAVYNRQYCVTSSAYIGRILVNSATSEFGISTEKHILLFLTAVNSAATSAEFTRCRVDLYRYRNIPDLYTSHDFPSPFSTMHPYIIKEHTKIRFLFSCMYQDMSTSDVYIWIIIFTMSMQVTENETRYMLKSICHLITSYFTFTQRTPQKTITLYD